MHFKLCKTGYFLFWEKHCGLLQQKNDGIFLTKPSDIGETFSKDFNLFMVLYIIESSLFLMYRSFIFSSHLNLVMQNAVKQLQLSKLIVLNSVSNFLIKVYPELFLPVLRFILNVSLSQNAFIIYGNSNLFLLAKRVEVFLLLSLDK